MIILTPVSSTNKSDRHDITEILLKVALNIATLTLILMKYFVLNSSGKSLSEECITLLCNVTITVFDNKRAQVREISNF
jgi:hypothetical protein